MGKPHGLATQPRPEPTTQLQRSTIGQAQPDQWIQGSELVRHAEVDKITKYLPDPIFAAEGPSGSTLAPGSTLRSTLPHSDPIVIPMCVS